MESATQSVRYHPRGPLSQVVSCLWYWEGAPQTHAKERLLPNGESSIIFNLRDDPMRVYDARNLTRYETYGRAMLSGARSDCFVIDTCQQERVAGIQFFPGGAFPFLRLPASEVEGLSVNLDHLWSHLVDSIRARLLAAPDTSTLLETLESCLLEQLARPLDLHPAVSYALQQFARCNAVRVAAVIDQIGLSPRRFVELFHRQVGLAPKTFCRVRRFQQVLRTIQQTGALDGARIALECGYYDQAHFIHDFQSFAGLTPCSYAAAATPHLNHVPIA